ncbi:hypothetical protein FOXG_06986 [Fusarium oxysporum f. sp. lycopersici 4287]|uniref:Chromo domain-containing protein n=1 Tax=Fusarium oxysporum f. sp. lycopersici (strain 4287 / CBS 123668 / FGSC 9935 / NRRL 34936) TaxID=426428 RepID=A0A0J9WMV6_FUSO4|nr:hypothetical protein FOXG_06986 [Fusarium oxysporum f. sp. lycopersici 4287]KNB06197.1 hypothetical protein FOXG_06986 [Fusarium oxysporum f. sp. lycopersici 4287]
MTKKKTRRGRSRLDQLSRIFKAKAITDRALAQKQSNFRGKRSFPTDVSPLLVLASLNATESAISHSMGQRIVEQTEAAHYMTMRGESTEIAQSPRFGPDVACFALSNHNLDGGLQPILRGEIESGMNRKHSGSRKQQTNLGKRMGPSMPEGPGEPVDAGNTAELAESEEQRDDAEQLRYEIDEIISHRIKNKTEIELETRWNGCSKPTFVDERTIQQDYPLVLYDYWEPRDGREEATGINLFHVFQIRRWKIKDKKLQFLVQWVGYPPKDSTWELAWKVEKCAKEMHGAYLKTHRAARSAWEKEESKTQT